MKTFICLITLLLNMNLFAQETIKLTGEIERVLTIGGEGSGFALYIKGSNRQLRYDLDGSSDILKAINEELNRPVISIFPAPILYFTVEGRFEMRRGIERGEYEVFNIVEFESNLVVFNQRPQICGLGGPAMYQPDLDICFQSLSTCQTSELRESGFIVANMGCN